jgi:hypothetical protein
VKKISNRWIPQNSDLIERKLIRACVYVYTNASGENCAVAYKGKAVRASFHHRYGSDESRTHAITKWFAQLERDEEVKAAYREAKKHFRCTLQIGQIVYTSWGYEQTNVDFYEVVALKGEKTVVVREIKSEIIEHGPRAMAGRASPLVGQYCGDAFSARAVSANALKIGVRKLAYLWDGRPVSCSWYG